MKDATDWTIELERYRLIRREEWGAKNPLHREFLKFPTHNVIFVYGTDSEGCSSESSCKRRVREIQRFELKKLGRPDIKYKSVSLCLLFGIPPQKAQTLSYNSNLKIYQFNSQSISLQLCNCYAFGHVG